MNDRETKDKQHPSSPPFGFRDTDTLLLSFTFSLFSLNTVSLKNANQKRSFDSTADDQQDRPLHRLRYPFVNPFSNWPSCFSLSQEGGAAFSFSLSFCSAACPATSPTVRQVFPYFPIPFRWFIFGFLQKRCLQTPKRSFKLGWPFSSLVRLKSVQVSMGIGRLLWEQGIGKGRCKSERNI